MIRFSALILTFSSALFAQTPIVSSVRGSLAPGGLVTIFGSNFQETSTVRVGNRAAAVLSYLRRLGDNKDHLEVQLPVEIDSGETTLEVLSGTSVSRPYPLTLDRFAPTFYSPFLQDSSGRGFSCSPGQSASPGQIVTALASGLGETNPSVPTGAQSPFSPLARTVVTPSIKVGGVQAEVMESALSPGTVGVYRVTFKVPAGEGWHSVSLGMEGKSSAATNLPVGRGILVFPAAKFGAGTGPGSPELIATALTCGSGSLGSQFAAGDPKDPPTTLNGVTIKVRDSAGVERLAPLFFAGRNQVNFLIPRGSARGVAEVTAISNSDAVFSGRIEIENVSPGLFTTQALEGRAPTGWAVRLHNGVQTATPVAQAGDPESEDASGYQSDLVPIDMGPEDAQVSLVLYGSGFRFRSSLGNVRASIDGVNVPVAYAGPGGENPGLDQVNLTLPRSLAGRGVVVLEMFADGQPANPVYLSFAPLR